MQPRLLKPEAALLFLLLLLASNFLTAQTRPRTLAPILEEQVLTQDVVRDQLDHYLMKRVPQLPEDLDRSSWQAEEQRIRKTLLEKVVFHGWPREWVTSPPAFEEMGSIEGGPGYQMTKYRYEIVPGFYSTAILYAPANPKGKAPAILNVNGHGQPGKKRVEKGQIQE